MTQRNPNFRRASICIAGLLPLIFTSLAMGSTDENANVAGDPHAKHRKMLQSDVRYVKSVAPYSMPDVAVLDQHGAGQRFQELMDSDSPLVLNFIFTSCTTICPVLSATFSQAQNDLQDQPSPPTMVSISVDPDYDTPERLNNYAESFSAGSNWMFLTGGKNEMLAIQKSFDAYRGDKLNHLPLTFLRASSDSPWVRLEGFTSARQLLEEYQELVAVALAAK
jgi:protein SCO1/2